MFSKILKLTAFIYIMATKNCCQTADMNAIICVEYLEFLVAKHQAAVAFSAASTDVVVVVAAAVFHTEIE